MLSINEIEYGVSGSAWPFDALFERTNAPGVATPVVEPCPAIPAFAMFPEILIAIVERSAPGTVGADPLIRESASLKPTLASLIIVFVRLLCRERAPF